MSLFKKQPTYYACEDCGHLYIKGTGQEIPVKDRYYFGSVSRKRLHYCSLHKKSYDNVIEGLIYSTYHKTFEVSADGTPIGYQKIKSK